MITRGDVEMLEQAGETLYRHKETTAALAVLAFVLRQREELQLGVFEDVFMCNPDESAGMADVIELNGYSRKVPHCS